MAETDYLASAEITELSDYLVSIKRIQSEWETALGGDYPRNFWFRGQQDDWQLLPKVFRSITNPDTGGESRYNELSIVQSFTALCGNYVAERFNKLSIELFAYMQHSGVPTRFLDWTESALMALYFAVADVTSSGEGTPVVWMMAPGGLNARAFGGSHPSSGPYLASSPFVSMRLELIGFMNPDGTIKKEFWDEEHREMRNQLRHPVAFYPKSYGNIRLATQKGCFTVHGTSTNPIEDLFRGNVSELYLRKLTVAEGRSASIRTELRVMGITPRSVFPDLAGLSQELNGVDYMLLS